MYITLHTELGENEVDLTKESVGSLSLHLKRVNTSKFYVHTAVRQSTSQAFFRYQKGRWLD